MARNEYFSHACCGVCAKPHTDPRILPCLHSFCQHCINRLIDDSGSQQMAKCPTCERNINIPMGGTNTLPQNLHLGFEVEIARYISKIVSNKEICDECMDENRGSAVIFCCTCYEFLCNPCYDHHKRHRKLSKHDMVELNQDGAKQLQAIMKPRDQYCSQPNHEDNKLNFHCETCNILVCRDCTAIVHKNHDVTELFTVAKKRQLEIKEAVQDAEEVLTKLTAAIDGNNMIIEQVKISVSNAHAIINQAFELLQRTLEERKTQLLSELEDIAMFKTIALSQQKEQFEKVVNEIGRYTEAASHILKTHTDYEVVALQGLIPNELQTILKSFRTMSLVPNQHCDISVSLQTEELVRKHSDFGHISGDSSSSSPNTLIFTSADMLGTNFASVQVESTPSNFSHVDRSMVHNGAVTMDSSSDTLIPQAADPHEPLIAMQDILYSPNIHDLDLEMRSRSDYCTWAKPQQVIKCNGGPFCIAIHENGDIYVACEDDFIYVFDQTNDLKDVIGNSGMCNGQFNGVHGIYIKDDILYVADYGNNRIQELTSGGDFLHKFGKEGSGPGELCGPTAVTVDADNRLIVSDSRNNRIQIFDLSGSCLLIIDGNGIGIHSFQDPESLALDPQGNIHVAANSSNVISVFTTNGKYIRTYGDLLLKGPIGIAIDGEGYCIVSENDSNCLSIFDPQGHKIHTVVNLESPHGIVLNTKDASVYVANYEANTVLKYIS